MKKITGLIFLVFFLVACDRTETKQHKSAEKIIVVTQQKNVTTLYYSGTLQPIRTIPVLSRVDGVVGKMNIKYGEYVEKGQILIYINSSRIADDFHKAVTDYLEKKDSYQSGLQSYKGSVVLHKAGVISDEDFTSEQSKQAASEVSYYQAKLALEDVLLHAGVPPKEIEEITLEQTTKINQLLQREFPDIALRAPNAGVVLFPTSSGADKDGNKKGELEVGDEIKQGQVVFSLGDLTGLSTTLKVSEININRVKTGLKAVVTGDAFPGITLQGSIAAVGAQANVSESHDTALNFFNVIIVIPHLTEDQRKIIHVGMTAKVALDLENPTAIMIPIRAVHEKNNQSMVTIIDPSGIKKEIPVQTGETSLDKVVITHGLKVGDKVEVDD